MAAADTLYDEASVDSDIVHFSGVRMFRFLKASLDQTSQNTASDQSSLEFLLRNKSEMDLSERLSPGHS